ncbi:O-antigen ligase family protein [Sulfurimonas sp. HSL3-2]|uniref:O-antigen ligase family protein n=1 Tax=Hydrocurvibacter mobilis TaxID=3131936 RepID=UPI0031F9DE5A
MLTLLILLSYTWSTSQSTIPTHFYYSDMAGYFYRYSMFFLFPMIIIFTKLKKEFIPMVIGSFILAMIVNELISYGVFFGLWTTLRGTPENPIPFHKNHITYSAYLAFTILLSLYKFIHIQNKYKKLFLLLFLTTMSINLFMSAGRTGQFSLFITAIFLSFIYIKNIKTLLMTFITLVTVFILAFSVMPTFKHRITQAEQSIKNILENKNKDTSLGTRIMAFDTIPYLVNKDNLLFGVGMGDKPYYVSTTLKKDYPYRLVNFDKHGFLHNSHIEILISNGIIGLLLYCSIFYFLFTINVKDKLIKYISYTLGISFLCFGMVADIFFFRAIMSLFSLFLGIIILQKYEEQKLIKNEN